MNILDFLRPHLVGAAIGGVVGLCVTSYAVHGNLSDVALGMILGSIATLISIYLIIMFEDGDKIVITDK